MPVDPQEFGRLEAKVQHLESTIGELRGDVKELLAAVENARGGWKTLLLVGGAAGSLGAFVTKMLPAIAQGVPR